MNNCDPKSRKWLFLVPVKKNIKKELEQKMVKCSDCLKEEMGDSVNIVFDYRGPGDENFSTKKIGLTGRLQKLADIRNECIKEHVIPNKYDFVVMCDSDVWYEKDILLRLFESAKNNNLVLDSIILAPGVYVEDLLDRFYDVAGFITTSGEHASYGPPHFSDGKKTIREMSSVGAFYVMPAWICNKVSYCGTPGPTDHVTVCSKALEMGVRTFCDLTIVVQHADLPRYGENWH